MPKKKAIYIENGSFKILQDSDSLMSSGSGIYNFTSNNNRLYSSPSNGTSLSTAAIVANTLYAMPFISEKRFIVSLLKMSVTVASAGSIIRSGIYSDNGNCYPNFKLNDLGQASGASVAVIQFSNSLPVSYAENLFWLVCISSAAITVKGFLVAGLIPLLGTDSNIGNAPGFGYSINAGVSTLPASFPTGAAIRTAAPLPYMGLFITG